MPANNVHKIVLPAKPGEPQELLPPAEGWLTRERVLVLLLSAVTLIAFYLCFRMVLPLLPAITWALAFAVVARPLHSWISRHVHNENLAAGLAVVAVTLLLVLPGLFIAQRLIDEVAAKIEWVQMKVDEGTLQQSAEKTPLVGGLLARFHDRINFGEQVRAFVGYLTADVQSILAGSALAVLQFVMMLFMLFFCFRDRRQALRMLRSLVPLSEPETQRVINRVSDTLHATVYSTVVVGALEGTLGGLLFWALGVQAPIFWGVVMGLAAVIPGASTVVVWIPNAVLLLLQGRYGAGVGVGVGALVIVGGLDNYLFSSMVGKRLRLHILPTFIALIGGVMVFGVTGVILGPVVLVLTLALIDIWRQRMRDNAVVEEGVNKETPAQKAAEANNPDKATLEPAHSGVLEKA